MKKLVTGATIRELFEAKQSVLEVQRSMTIITPEARTVAGDLGITIVENDNATSGAACINQSPSNLAVRQQIRASIVAQLPADQKTNESLITQLIDKVIAQGGSFTPVAAVSSMPTASKPEEGTFQQTRAHSGVKVVKGNSLKYGLFEGAGEQNSVGIIDVVGAEDKSTMAAGFMTWQNCFFPWTLTYDEISYVIEGELHIKTGGETIVGKVGDVLFIPKGSSIEFGTPTHVRFLFVSYPVNWADN